MRVAAVAAVAAGLVAMTACDGAGGGGDPSGSSGTDDWNPAWVQKEDAVLELVNEARSRGGRCGTESFPPSEPLVMDGILRGLAREYSRRMAEEEFFDHVAPDGTDPFDRMTAAGFEGELPWGENLAAGYPEAQDVFDGWMASPGHCANILLPDYGAIGIGTFDRPDDPMAAVYYWTQEFAGTPQP